MKKKIAFLLVVNLFLLSLFTGCANTKEPTSKTGFYFDTVITITLYDTKNIKYIDECFGLAEKYENLLSKTIENSDIWNINHNPLTYVPVSEETFQLVEAGILYSQKSNGIFDISVGALSSLWNLQSEDFSLPTENDIQKALSTISYENILLDKEKHTICLNQENAQLDLGGIAKGYIADQMKAYLESVGVTSGIINLGGNVLCLGPKSGDDRTYTIAIQKPFSEDGQPIASVKIVNKSVVTSGTYQRYVSINGTIYHHILDLSNGYPCNNDLSSVSIICDNSIDGDAYSTMVFLMGLNDGMSFIEATDNMEAIFITTTNEIYYSSGIGHTIPFKIYENPSENQRR